MINAIDPNQLLTQMRAMQNEAQQPVTPAADPAKAGNDQKVDFGNVMQSAVNSVNELQQNSGDMKEAFVRGDKNVTLADTMIASQKASVAFEATVQTRNKMIEAYQTVMRMSI